jgi:predicted outer membrane protein
MGATGSGMGSDMPGMSGMGMNSELQSLMNATGEDFNKLFVSQMLTMHEAQLKELQTASTTLRDADIKTVVLKAIPKVRMHTEMLRRMNTGTTSGTSSNN